MNEGPHELPPATHGPLALLRGIWRPALGMAFFLAALWGLYQALEQHYYQEVAAAMRSLPARGMALGLALTVVSYMVLTLYDVVGFRSIPYSLPWPRICFASFIGYVLGNNGCNAATTGAVVRYWAYSSLHVPARQIAQVVVFCNAGFWLGYILVSALLLLLHALRPAQAALLPLGKPLALLMAVLLCGYLVLVIRRRPLRVLRWSYTPPALPFALAQAAIGALDIVCMASVLWALLPAVPRLGFAGFLQVFMTALVAGAASQVPGGLGVFETTFLYLLPPGAHAPAVVAALVAFRAIYFVLPLAMAACLLAVRAWHARRMSLRNPRKPRMRAGGLSAAAAQAFSLAVFCAGALLLFSGALPAAQERLAWLSHVEPLGVIETSHFLSSLAGAALLLLAYGLQRRLAAAYLLAMALLASGILFSLARSFNVEEAALLALMLAALAPSRRYFYRRAARLAVPPGPGWWLSIFIVLAGSFWLYGFAFKHVEYGNQFWWRFAIGEEAPRALRATAGAAVFAAGAALAFLLRQKYRARRRYCINRRMR